MSDPSVLFLPFTVPKHELVAIGTHGFYKEVREKCEWYCFLKTIINTIEPKSVIVYGSLGGKMFDDFQSQTTFVFSTLGLLKDVKGRRKVMSTKGASNHYGNARHGRQGHITTHTGFAWAKGFNRVSLLKHVKEHMASLGFSSANDYNQQNRIELFLQLFLPEK